VTITDDPPARIATSVSRSEAAANKARGGTGSPAVTPARKKSKKVKIIALVGGLLLFGAVAKFTVLAPSASGAGPAKPPPGPVIAMDELTLNLNGGHFLRLKMSLTTAKGTSAELDVTDGVQAVIDEYSNRSVTSLTGKVARDKAKGELLAELQKIYPKKLLDLTYTEFVMQ
jgi:flagellar FliL protein